MKLFRNSTWPAAFAVAVAIMWGPQAFASFWQWSTTASSNASADPTINWREGQPPSSVNDSARAMMARLAEWRDDISGGQVTGGTGSAYTLTTSEGVPSTPNEGQMLVFVAHTPNNASATLAVDGGNAFPIMFNSAPVPAATLIGGTPYRVRWTGAGGGEWLLESVYGNPYNVPLGGLLASTLSFPPNSNFIFPAGNCLSTTTYASYWTALGSPSPGGCPSGQFPVIDIRGRLPAGLDLGVGRLTSNGAGCGTAMNNVGAVCANGSEFRQIVASNVPTISVQATGSFQAFPNGDSTLSFPVQNGSWIATSNGSGGTQVPGRSGGTGIVGTNQVQGSVTVTGVSQNTSGSSTGQSFPSVPPIIGVYYYLRVL